MTIHAECTKEDFHLIYKLLIYNGFPIIQILAQSLH